MSQAGVTQSVRYCRALCCWHRRTVTLSLYCTRFGTSIQCRSTCSRRDRPRPPRLKVTVARSSDQSEPSWPNAVPVSLEAGGGISCRPNPAATLVYFSSILVTLNMTFWPWNLLRVASKVGNLLSKFGHARPLDSRINFTNTVKRRYINYILFTVFVKLNCQ